MTDTELAQIIWDYMRYEQPLEKADIIIGLGSSDVRTAKWCAKLYQEGWAPKILFTGAQGRVTRDTFQESEADVFATCAEGQGVPADSIFKEARSVNTGDNIVMSQKLLEEKNILHDTIILVTKPYMLRRAYATFMKQWPGEKKPRIICSAVDESLEEYCTDKDYPFHHVASCMVGDVQRIKEYPKLGFQIEQDIPEEVWAAYEELVRRGYTEHLLERGN